MNSRIITKKKTDETHYPILGKIKVGMKNPDRGFPMSLDYFRVDCRENKVYENLFLQAHGEKPSTIPIVFLSDDAEACRHYLELRDNTGKVLAEGDGLNFRVAVFNPELKISQWVEAKEATILSKYASIEAFMDAMVAKAGTDKYGKQMKWQEVLRLRFLLPKVSELGLLGVWEFRTKAVASSIPQIVNYFDTIKNGAGTAKMLPFDLKVRKVKSDKAGSTQTYTVVDMVANISAENIATLRSVSGKVSLAQGILTSAKIEELAKEQPAIEPSYILLPSNSNLTDDSFSDTE